MNKKEQQPRISSGIPDLDDILVGGWPANHLYLIEGDPGTGKTTLAFQFLLEGAKLGESVLYVTLSESKQELEDIAESHHWEIKAVPIFEYTPTEESLQPENEYSALHPSEVEFQDTMQNILKKVEEIKPKRLVFDSLSEIRLLARDSLRYRRQALALKQYFLTRKCTVLLLDDRTSEAHDLQLQSISHGVLLLERLPRDFGVERRRLRIAKLRGSRFREGFHDYAIETGGVRVFPRLIASEHRLPAESSIIESGIEALDGLWGGGVPRGSTTLLTGPAGTGKSSIAMSYAVSAARRGEHAVFFHFDETLGPILTRSAALGMDVAPHLEAKTIQIHRFDPAEVSPGGFSILVRECVEQYGATVVVIDSLNGFLNAMTGEQQLLLHMHELCTFLNQQRVSTFLVLAQAGIFGSQMSPPVDVSYLADNVLLLRYFEFDGHVRKALSVVKKRAGEHESTIRELRFENGAVQLGAPLTDFRGILTGVPVYTGSSSTLEGAIDEQQHR